MIISLFFVVIVNIVMLIHISSLLLDVSVNFFICFSLEGEGGGRDTHQAM
jgi:hypothetical protein